MRGLWITLTTVLFLNLGLMAAPAIDARMILTDLSEVGEPQSRVGECYPPNETPFDTCLSDMMLQWRLTTDQEVWVRTTHTMIDVEGNHWVAETSVSPYRQAASALKIVPLYNVNLGPYHSLFNKVRVVVCLDLLVHNGTGLVSAGEENVGDNCRSVEVNVLH